jgi:hypothetical protein
MCKHYISPRTPRNKVIYFTHLGAECYWEHLVEYKDNGSFIYMESCVRTLSCLYLMALSNLMCRVSSSGTTLNLAVWCLVT